jgi:hypothetical protein
MPRTSSYLQHIARRPAGTLPLLQPPRALRRRWEVATPQEAVNEITPSLAAQHPLGSANFSPVIEDSTDSTSTPRRQKPPEEIQLTVMKPGKPVHGVASAAGQSLLTARSNATAQGKATSEKQQSNVTSRPNARQESRAPTAANTSTRGRRTDAAHPESDVSTKAPIRPAPLTLVPQAQDRPADQPYLADQINAKTQTRTTSEEQYIGVTLRPDPRQELTATRTPITSTRRERTADAAHPESDVNTKAPLRPALVTLVPQAQDRPMASPAKRDTQQGSSVHIGTIDIHIMPPPAPPVSPVPSPTAHGTTARPADRPALSRELTSFVGLRQG